MSHWAEMEKLRPAELAALIAEIPLIYVPAGIYEWHEAQNPLGTDTLKMVEICRRVAARTGGAVHMPSYLGLGPFAHPISGLGTGGLNFSEQLIRSYLLELFAQLERMGFYMIVLLYGHTYPENCIAHEEAARDYTRSPGTAAKVLCLNDIEPVVRYRYKVADHAAKWETSFMLAAHPDRVDMKSIPADHGGWHGLDPRLHASAGEGERMYELIAEEVARLVKLANSAPRELLHDGSFLANHDCWKDCQNYTDLQTDYWGGDEKWEDPFCYYCIHRAPGVMQALVEIKGRDWASKWLVQREQRSKKDGYQTMRALRAFQELRREMENCSI